MALECRACGEKLPMLVLSDAAAPPEVPGAVATIWKTQSPEIESVERFDDEAVAVHGGSAPAPAIEPDETLRDEEADASAVELASAVATQSDPLLEAVASASATRHPTVIELLHVTRMEPAKPDPMAAPEAQRETVEAVIDSFELNAESESEIEVSDEAGTLVEASVAPVTYTPPEEISITETRPAEDIATQIRAGAWRSAMSLTPSSRTALAPVFMPMPPQRKRRLSLQRVGLAVAAIGAVAAGVYSVRLAPGTSAPTTAQAEAPAVPQPITVAPRAVEVLTPAAAAVTATPAAGLARNIESTPTPTAVEAPREKPKEAPPVTKEAVAAQVKPAAPITEPVVKATPVAEAVAKAAPRAQAAPTPSLVSPAPAQASRISKDAPRPCTASVAALGLCTAESSPEGK